MTDETTPIVELLARALAEQNDRLWDGVDDPEDPWSRNNYLAGAADLLRRAGISETAGLVWEEGGGLLWRAWTPFGTRYEIIELVYRKPILWRSEHTANAKRRVGGEDFPTPEAARAACEADYAARMLAAWPAVAAEVEGIRASLPAVASPLAATPIDDSESPSGSDNISAEAENLRNAAIKEPQQ